MPVKRFLVTGIVQGVGFRLFVRREAIRLGLHGFVRNLPDGSVEAVGSGDDSSLRSLEEALRSGPPGAIVDSVEVGEGNPVGVGDIFTILH